MTDLTWLPNFLIAGAPKAGTSSLQRWIADHPDAFGSTDKETYFLVDSGTHMHRPDFHVSLGLETWKSQFPVPLGTRPKIIVESTPANIYYQTALQVAPDLPSRPKCLFILREPGAQIHSLFTYFRDNWDWVPTEMGFAEFLEAVRQGNHDFKGNELARNALTYARYIDFLEPWQARLGKDRMMVATFDELQSNQRGLTQRVAGWLGLDPDFYEGYGFARENETYTPRNRALQSLNVKLRGHLPKGGAYNFARTVYRRLNTQTKHKTQDGDKELISRLGQEFSSSNRRLAEQFGLDLRDWPV